MPGAAIRKTERARPDAAKDERERMANSPPDFAKQTRRGKATFPCG
jgi:hypothetical protein